MTPSPPLLAALAPALGLTAPPTMKPVAGGCIHRAWRVGAAVHGHFAKTADTPDGVASLLAEADGLRRLGALPGVPVPSVTAFVRTGHEAALVLPWIDVAPHAALGATVGRAVATLHAHPAPAWGAPQDNRIALLPQRNTPLPCGDAFWADRRLRAGADLARAAGALAPADGHAVDQLADRLERGIAGSRPIGPAWLHGDLWCGNALVDHSGRPWLIDPAVYGGDPRVDLAMADLFGGFPPAFRGAWHDVHGQRPDDDLRRRLYQLWPLLIHAALFGGAYGAQAGRLARGLLAEIGG